MPRGRSLRADARGLSSTEYIIAAACIAVAGLALWRYLGEALGAETEVAAAAIPDGDARVTPTDPTVSVEAVEVQAASELARDPLSAPAVEHDAPRVEARAFAVRAAMSDEGGGDVPAGGTGAGSEPGRQPSALRDNRDRLLADMAARSGMSASAYWQQMTPVQRAVFLTITDLLGRSFIENTYDDTFAHGDSCSPSGTLCTNGCDVAEEGDCRRVSAEECVRMGRCSTQHELRTNWETALDHVTTIYGVVGNNCARNDPTCTSRGGDNHRLYFSADDRLIGVIRNFGHGLPLWDDSNDFKAHSPFTNSSQTTNTSWSFNHDAPTGQMHFWRWDQEAVRMNRPGAQGVYDPHLVEMDIDYSTTHASNPLSGENLARYERGYRWYGFGQPFEWDYAPSPDGTRACRCSGRACGESDGCGGSCCNGSGCRVTRRCAACTEVDACGSGCAPRRDGLYCEGGQCGGGECIASATCNNGRCEPGENGQNCGGDCCDNRSSCHATRGGDGSTFCRTTVHGGRWEYSRWISNDDLAGLCDEPQEVGTSRSYCGQQVATCCPGGFRAGEGCP